MTEDTEQAPEETTVESTCTKQPPNALSLILEAVRKGR